MLRKQVRSLLVNPLLRARLSKFMRVLSVVGFLWILSFPYIAGDSFTSENAFKGEFLRPKFDLDPTLIPVFTKFKNELAPLSDAEIRSYVFQELGKRAEVYTQPLKSVGNNDAANIYSYLRSKDGPGLECIALAVPLNLKAGLAHALTFVEMMVFRKPDWQSKDLLVLFYEDSDYSFAV